MRSAHHLLIRLMPAIPLFSWRIAFQASAGTITETASKWGLIGPWSLDCSLPPDRGRGTVLILCDRTRRPPHAPPQLRRRQG